MAWLLDSYSESNQNSTAFLDSANHKGIAQSWKTPPAIYNLNSAKFWLKKAGSPTGNATANLYTHSGTFGTSSVPTGAALATSDVLDVSTLTLSYQLITLNFSGSNQYLVTGNTNYVISIEYTAGDASNLVHVGWDFSSPTHAGNYSQLNGSWAATATADCCFYVYGDVQHGSLRPNPLRPRIFAPGNAR